MKRVAAILLAAGVLAAALVLLFALPNGPRGVANAGEMSWAATATPTPTPTPAPPPCDDCPPTPTPTPTPVPPPVARTVVVAGVTVTVQPGAGATQADVDRERDAITSADASSTEYRKTVLAAGDRHSKAVTVTVVRDQRAVTLGLNSPVGSNQIIRDLGDDDQLINHIEDTEADRQKLVSAFKGGLVSGHEFDHAASASESDAIDTHNKILKQLEGLEFIRCETEDGKVIAVYQIDTREVRFRWDDFKAARKQANKFAPCPPGGGIAEPIVLGPDSAADTPGSSSAGDHAVPIAAAAGVAGVLAVAAGGWHVRRRLS